MESKTTEWKVTTKRFVSFFDIMGFKDMVERNSHASILKRLNKLKFALEIIEGMNTHEGFKKAYKVSETKSITFSDSIVLFSKGDKLEDACKILSDSAWLIDYSLKNGIPIKGAISFGQITVDIKNALFFGRPIIDAFLLHDQLNLYSSIIDNTCETKFRKLKIPAPFDKLIFHYKAPIKSGKVFHYLLKPEGPKQIKANTINVNKMYEKVAGSPRLYIDNTLDYYTNLIQ